MHRFLFICCRSIRANDIDIQRNFCSFTDDNDDDHHLQTIMNKFILSEYNRINHSNRMSYASMVIVIIIDDKLMEIHKMSTYTSSKIVIMTIIINVHEIQQISLVSINDNLILKENLPLHKRICRPFSDLELKKKTHTCA